VGFVVGAHGYTGTKAVNDDTGYGSIAQKLYGCLFPGKHAEIFAGIRGDIHLLVIGLSAPRLIHGGEIKHLVHAVMFHFPGIRVIGNKIIVFVIPGKKPGADLIESAVFAQLHFFSDIPVEVVEADLPVFCNGRMDDIHAVIDFFIAGFVAVCNDNLTL